MFLNSHSEFACSFGSTALDLIEIELGDTKEIRPPVCDGGIKGSHIEM